MTAPSGQQGGPEGAQRVSLATIALEWGRIGITGFGGPPAHIALLRRLCVERRRWLSAQEFEDGIAATSLLPGPASTQLAIYCAWRLRGPAGALVGGICFIMPGLVVILALASLFLAAHPPRLVEGAAAGAGAAVPAVAVQAALELLPASRRRAWEDAPGPSEAPAAATPAWAERTGRPAGGAGRARRLRWICYLAAGGAAGALTGSLLVVVLAACGLVEAAVRAGGARAAGRPRRGVPGLAALGGVSAPAAGLAGGGLLALAWVAFKVGALSYGGGFVIIPLMQHDAVAAYHWMTTSQFLGAVALGQITPGPVVLTVAAVGYAAAGVGGGLLAALVTFTPSFVFVLFGGPRFGRLRQSATVQAFLAGAGPAAVGAIAGASIPLARGLTHLWQLGVLALACLWLLVARRGVVPALAGAGALGALAALAGAPVSR